MSKQDGESEPIASAGRRRQHRTLSPNADPDPTAGHFLASGKFKCFDPDCGDLRFRRRANFRRHCTNVHPGAQTKQLDDLVGVSNPRFRPVLSLSQELRQHSQNTIGRKGKNHGKSWRKTQPCPGGDVGVRLLFWYKTSAGGYRPTNNSALEFWSLARFGVDVVGVLKDGGIPGHTTLLPSYHLMSRSRPQEGSQAVSLRTLRGLWETVERLPHMPDRLHSDRLLIVQDVLDECDLNQDREKILRTQKDAQDHATVLLAVICPNEHQNEEERDLIEGLESIDASLDTITELTAGVRSRRIDPAGSTISC